MNLSSKVNDMRGMYEKVDINKSFEISGNQIPAIVLSQGT